MRETNCRIAWDDFDGWQFCMRATGGIWSLRPLFILAWYWLDRSDASDSNQTNPLPEVKTCSQQSEAYLLVWMDAESSVTAQVIRLNMRWRRRRLLAHKHKCQLAFIQLFGLVPIEKMSELSNVHTCRSRTVGTSCKGKKIGRRLMQDDWAWLSLVGKTTTKATRLTS